MKTLSTEQENELIAFANEVAREVQERFGFRSATCTIVGVIGDNDAPADDIATEAVGALGMRGQEVGGKNRIRKLDLVRIMAEWCRVTESVSVHRDIPKEAVALLLRMPADGRERRQDG